MGMLLGLGFFRLLVFEIVVKDFICEICGYGGIR